jgi:hypothetical protein
LHYSSMTFGVSQGEGVVESWRFGEIERARCCVIASTGVEKALYVVGLSVRTSVIF